MGRVSNKNQHLKKIAQLSVKSRQESIKDKNHEINSANELIDNEIWDTYKWFKFVMWPLNLIFWIKSHWLLQEIIESYGHKIIFYPHRNVFGSCIRFGSIKSNS